tara:strand:- start:549 stop:3860 length:3312 start_codon:yes stop_codon:yes gene_type:complete
MATTGTGSVKQLSQQLDGFSNKIKKLYGELGKLQKGTKEYNKKQKELNATNKQAVKLSDQLYAKQKRLISGNKKHKSSIDAATTSQKKFQQTMTSTAASTGKAAKAQSNFGKKLGTAAGTIARYAGAAALLNVGLKVFRALTTDAIKEAAKFQKQMANLSAVAGVSGDEMKKLGEEALRVAGSTKFTADEIVKLQTELSKLGFTADEVVKSTLPIAFAAQALGSPLESTAALVGKVRNQFGLLVEQTTEIADVLVTSINESALSFESFGTAMQYVGPIATSLGLSLQQTAGAMAVLADSGFTASRVGTGLRGILTEIGKTSGDAEKSLQKLAEQNINLAEAAELVGKRNAAQLITLLKNLDAIEESSTKYYQQGRAVESAAKQIDTYSGQLDILTSNFKEFQIEIGNVIAESNILLMVLDEFFPKGAKTARAFKAINDIGFEAFSDGALKVSEGADATVTALEILGVKSDDFEKARVVGSKTFGESVINYLTAFKVFGEEGVIAESDNAVALKNKVEGVIEKLKEQAQAKLDDIAITEGQTIAQQVYGKTVDKIIQQSVDGKNVNKEISATYKEIGSTIELLDGRIEKSSGLRQLQLKAERNVYKQMQEQLNNSLKNESELLKIKTKIQRDALKLRLDDIKRQTKEEVKEINERAKIETSISKTAEERADIEAERTQLVSDAYVKQSAAIRDLSKEFETQIDRIKEAALASDDLAEILTSDVISDVQKAVSDYSKEIKKLDDNLKSGKINQDEYNAARDAQYDALLNNINAFKQLIDISPEVAAYFDEIAKKALEAGYAIGEVATATDKAKKDFDDFKDDLKEGAWADLAKKAVDALGESLSAFNDTSFENLKNSEDAKLDLIKSRYKTEEEILKSQLNNQLITESQFRAKQRELQKAKIAEENSIEKNIFDAEKKQDRTDAILEGGEAAAQAYIEAFKKYEPATAVIVGSIGAGIAAAQTTAQVSAINRRKFFPKKFADGGVVNGPAHDQGGVPFSVQGNSGYEMEGGEYVINKRATSMHKDLLDRINKSGMTRPQVGKVKFAQGGLVSSPINESVDYLKAIAEATTSTAIGVSKPVRAFVSDKDLRTNSNERRLRDRNDRI